MTEHTEYCKRALVNLNVQYEYLSKQFAEHSELFRTTLTQTLTSWKDLQKYLLQMNGYQPFGSEKDRFVREILKEPILSDFEKERNKAPDSSVRLCPMLLEMVIYMISIYQTLLKF